MTKRLRVTKRNADLWTKEWLQYQFGWAQTFDQKTEGVSYYWELSGPDGAWFLLFKEPHHTIKDIVDAAAKLQDDHDVTGVNYVEVKPNEMQPHN